MTQFKSQSGRSMVEMLGVLAIVGVLSIGGIAGYSYGMDKYRANETINQIMLRAIDLMTQAGNGNETLSLSAWENKGEQYDFSNVGYTEDGLIAFDMGTNNPIPKSVCEMVYDGMSSMAEQIDINKTRAESNDACAEENEMTFYFTGEIGTRCIPECAENEYCYNGICFKGGVPEISNGPIGECSSSSDDCGKPCYSCKRTYETTAFLYACYPMPSGTCTIDTKEGLCHWGECYPKVGDGCTTNADCTEPGTFCASANNNIEMRFKEGETGSCVPLDFVRKEIAGKTYYISNKTMSWWDVEYACDAIGPNIKMISVEDLVTETDGSEWKGGAGFYTPTVLWEEINAFAPWVWTQNMGSDYRYPFSVRNQGDKGFVFTNAARSVATVTQGVCH